MLFHLDHMSNSENCLVVLGNELYSHLGRIIYHLEFLDQSRNSNKEW